jgi:hypothetical protein
MIQYKINEDLAEETGIHLGDGSMNIYKGRAFYTVACHWRDDRAYMDDFILPLIKKIYGKTPKPRNWSKGSYGFRICSKEIIKFKSEVLDLPLGKKINARIPEQILCNDSLMIAFIRGLYDTDGSLTLWKTNNKLYPRIFFLNIAKDMVEQVKMFLLKKGFKVTEWKTEYKEKNWNTAYKLSINGEKMLKKWVEEIGFRNPKNIQKLKLFDLNTKFYK